MKQISGFFQSFRSKPKAADYDALRKDLTELMTAPDFDDGSYAPLLIRLAWHSSGTFDKESNTGGSNGATMRHTVEASDPENNGLDIARDLLNPIKKKHPSASLADIWILAAYVALEITGGPVIEFTKGRVDKGEKFAIKPGRLPGAEHGLGEGLDEEGRINGWENLAQHVRDVFNRMGFDDREIVALISGGHVYGRCHPEHTGYAGAWVEAPTQFSNEYAADMLEDEWMYVQEDTKVNGVLVPEETRPTNGKRQYMTKWEPVSEEDLKSTDLKDYPLGKYISTDELEVREEASPDSYIIDELEKKQEVNILAVKKEAKGIRGQLDTGGWVWILDDEGGELKMERVGNLDLDLEGVLFFKPLRKKGEKLMLVAAPELEAVGDEKQTSELEKSLNEINVSELIIQTGKDGALKALFGKVTAAAEKEEVDGKFILIVNFESGEGMKYEKVVKGVNDEERKPIKRKKVKYQMMLPSDMVLLWDEKFCSVLKEYAEDEELLKKEFGEAYKKLTELGVPACPAMK